MKPELIHHGAYRISVSSRGVDVFEAGIPSRSGPLYKTDTVERAKTWIDAYVDGQVWACQEMIR